MVVVSFPNHHSFYFPLWIQVSLCSCLFSVKVDVFMVEYVINQEIRGSKPHMLFNLEKETMA